MKYQRERERDTLFPVFEIVVSSLVVSLTVGEDPPKDRCTETDAELFRGESADADFNAFKMLQTNLVRFFFLMQW